MDDTEIINLYFARQESAIEETRKKFGPRLYAISKNILYNHEDTEECVNDTLMKAWGVIPPHRPTFLGAFLAKIARNVSINKWEAKTAAKRGGGELNLMLSELEETLPSAKTTEKEYEASQLTESINSFLRDIDKGARVVFVLRYFHGESIRGICEKHGVSESKVKSILFRVRKKLKAHLEKEGVMI